MSEALILTDEILLNSSKLFGVDILFKIPSKKESAFINASCNKMRMDSLHYVSYCVSFACAKFQGAWKYIEIPVFELKIKIS